MYCITTCTWPLHSMQYVNSLNNDKATNTEHTPPTILLKSAVILRDLPFTSERTWLDVIFWALRIWCNNINERWAMIVFTRSIYLGWSWVHLDIASESGRFGALKSDSPHHFFRNVCTKSGSLRFSQFSGCWLILSVYIIMTFDFSFVRLFGVR